MLKPKKQTCFLELNRSVFVDWEVSNKDRARQPLGKFSAFEDRLKIEMGRVI